MMTERKLSRFVDADSNKNDSLTDGSFPPEALTQIQVNSQVNGWNVPSLQPETPVNASGEHASSVRLGQPGEENVQWENSALAPPSPRGGMTSGLPAMVMASLHLSTGTRHHSRETVAIRPSSSWTRSQSCDHIPSIRTAMASSRCSDASPFFAEARIGDLNKAKSRIIPNLGPNSCIDAKAAMPCDGAIIADWSSVLLGKILQESCV